MTTDNVRVTMLYKTGPAQGALRAGQPANFHRRVCETFGGGFARVCNFARDIATAKWMSHPWMATEPARSAHRGEGTEVNNSLGRHHR